MLFSKLNRIKSTQQKFSKFIYLETLGNYLHNATGLNPKSVIEFKWENKQDRDFSTLEKLLKINHNCF